MTHLKLMTDAIRAQLPPLGDTEGIPLASKVAYVKYFTPDSNWTWYGCEFDGLDTFFGYVQGMESEWGYFSLEELSSVRGPLGLSVERDLAFSPQPIVSYLRTADGRESDFWDEDSSF